MLTTTNLNRGSGGTVNKKNVLLITPSNFCKVVINFVVNTWVWLLCINREHLVLLPLKEFYLDPKIPIMVLPGTIWSFHVLNRVLYL